MSSSADVKALVIKVRILIIHFTVDDSGETGDKLTYLSNAILDLMNGIVKGIFTHNSSIFCCCFV